MLGLNAAPAAETKKPEDAKTSVEAQKSAYPLDTCAVAGEPLGSMGKPYEYIHKEAGKPDRLVLMCCKGCVRGFKKDPAKYIARIDAAAKADREARNKSESATPDSGAKN